MSNVKNDFVKPIVVLMLICLVIAAALAFTNKTTAPIIEETQRLKAEAARKEVLPDADSFELMDLSDLPARVTEIYKSTNDVGFVFMLKTKGYSGDMKLICGIDKDGKIVACKTLSQTETQGLGTRTTEPEFRDQFVGKDSSLSGVDTITGATISSKAYLAAIQEAFAAYEIAKEAE